MPNTGFETVSGRGPLSVEHHTADDTLTAAESGTAHTNKGAAGMIALVLPVSTVGMRFSFYVGAAQELRVDPNGTEKISDTATGVAGAAGKYISADAIGETMDIVCYEAGIWSLSGAFGTWSVQA